nr:MAG TPA: hypothetical protein [Caudoviricetes sp.]
MIRTPSIRRPWNQSTDRGDCGLKHSNSGSGALKRLLNLGLAMIGGNVSYGRVTWH